MSTFFQPLSYSTTSIDTANTITISSPVYMSNPLDTITLTSTILSSDEYNINWSRTEWVDSFPEWERMQRMCNEYPGLKIAFEKFKTTYKLVKDDYDTPKNNRKAP